MYLEIFLADFAVFHFFGGISRDLAEIPEFRGSATARNIRSPVIYACPCVNKDFNLDDVFSCFSSLFLSTQKSTSVMKNFLDFFWHLVSF